jgi:hypothetical protein
MTPEQQRIKIAEACGWRGIIEYKKPVYTTDCVGMPSYHEKTFIGHAPYVEIGNPKRDDPRKTSIPDYLNDLNAVHGAKKAIIASGQITKTKYLNRLRDTISRREEVPTNSVGQKLVSDYHLADATPSEICETLLKTLNLWED